MLYETTEHSRPIALRRSRRCPVAAACGALLFVGLLAPTLAQAQAERPVVTIAADVGEVIYNLPRNVFALEDASYTLTRTGPTDSPLEVSVTLTQDRWFLPAAARARTVIIPPGEAAARLVVGQTEFTGAVAADGTLTAAVATDDAYDVGAAAEASVAMTFVARAVTARIAETAYEFAEDVGAGIVHVLARTAPGLPAPVGARGLQVSISTEPGEAVSPADYAPLSETKRFEVAEWRAAGNGFEARVPFAVLIHDDAIDEPAERLEIVLEYTPDSKRELLTLVRPDESDCTTSTQPDRQCRAELTITDNDEAGVAVAPTELTAAEADPTGAEYSLVLETQPTDTVIVTVSGAAGTDVTAEPGTVTFTSESWSSPQVVTVTAADDEDNLDDTVTLEHSAAGGGYDAVDIADVTVTVRDDDASLVTIEADVDEVIYNLPRRVFALEDVSYTLTRTGPTDSPLEVTVTLTQDRRFLPAAALARTVIIPPGEAAARLEIGQPEFTGGADADGTLAATVAAGEYYTAGEPAEASVGLKFSGAPVTLRLAESAYVVAEGAGQVEVTVRAETAPGLPAPEVAPFHGFVLQTRAGSAVSPHDYTYRSEEVWIARGDWLADGDRFVAAPSFGVVIHDDALSEAAEEFTVALEHGPGTRVDLVRFLHADGDACMPFANSESTCKATVTIADNDTAGVTVSPTALSVTEGDAAGAVYTVALETQPAGDVVVTVSGMGGTAVTVDPARLTFTPGNWSDTQPLNVTAVDDQDAVHDTVTLEHSAAGGGYDAVDIADVTVTVTDDDAPLVTIAADVDEVIYNLPRDVFALEDASYTVTRTGPTDAPLEVSVNLTQDRRFLPRAVLERAVTIPAGAASAALEIAQTEFRERTSDDGQLSAVVAAGQTYSAGEPAEASIALKHNGAAVTLRLAEPAYVFGEDTGTAELVVRAETAPGLPMPRESTGISFKVATIPGQAVSPDDFAALSARRQLTADDWEARGRRFTAAVAIGLEIRDDTIEEPEEQFSVELQPSPATDGSWVRFLLPDGYPCGPLVETFRQCRSTVTITDNDHPAEPVVSEEQPAIVLSPTVLQVVEGDRATYALRLATRPTGAVTVAVEGSGGADLTLDRTSLAFNAGNWSRAQTVEVAALADDDRQNERIMLIHNGAGGGYDGVTAELPVVVTDSGAQESGSEGGGENGTGGGGGNGGSPDGDAPDGDAQDDDVPDEDGDPPPPPQPNAPPRATDDVVETPEDTAILIDVLANDVDPDGDPLQLVAMSAAAHGAALLRGSVVRYEPDGEFAGEDRFAYTVADGRGGQTTASVRVSVTPVNDPPAAVGAIPDQVLEEGGAPVTLDVAPYFEDVDDAALAFGATASDAAPAAVTLAGSLLTLSPRVRGVSAVTVTARDSGGLTARQVFAVRVGDRATREVAIDTLAALGRGYLSSARSTLGRRVEAAADRSHVTVAGQRIPLSAAELAEVGLEVAERMLGDTGAPPRLRPGIGGRRALAGGAEQFLRGTDVELSLGGAPRGAGGARSRRRWTVWGQGDLQAFGGAPESSFEAPPAAYDGELRSAYLGVDARMGERWLTGVAAARSRGAAAWRAGTAAGELRTALTAVHPYLRWSSGSTEIWAMGGFGRGSATNVRAVGGGDEESGLGLGLGLIEARRGLAAGDGLRLGLRGEVSWARLSTADGDETLDGLLADVRRANLGVEVTREWSGSGGWRLAPFGQVDVRHDGGAGQTGYGLEAAGGGRLTAGVLRVEARGRMLVVHTAAGYKERGANLTVGVGEGAGRPGLTLAVTPRWGASGAAGTLWQDQLYERIGSAQREDGSMDARVGYGWRAPGGLVLAPFGGYGYGRGARRLRLGAILADLDAVASPTVRIELSGERRLHAAGGGDLRVSLLGVVSLGRAAAAAEGW